MLLLAATTNHMQTVSYQINNPEGTSWLWAWFMNKPKRNNKKWEWLTTDSCVRRRNITSSRQVIIFRARLHKHWSRAMVGGQTGKWRMMIADEMRFAQKQFFARANGRYQNVGQSRVVFIRVSLNFSTEALFEVQSGTLAKLPRYAAFLSTSFTSMNHSMTSSNIWNVPWSICQPNSQISQQRFDDVVARSVSVFLTLSLELQLFHEALSVQFPLFALIVRLQLPEARKLLTPQNAKSRWNYAQKIPSTHQQYTT